VDLADVIRHDDAVVVRRGERRGREDLVEPFGLLGVEWVFLGRDAAELFASSNLP
jgi:hypothetical protein